MDCINFSGIRRNRLALPNVLTHYRKGPLEHRKNCSAYTLYKCMACNRLAGLYIVLLYHRIDKAVLRI